MDLLLVMKESIRRMKGHKKVDMLTCFGRKSEIFAVNAYELKCIGVKISWLLNQCLVNKRSGTFQKMI